MLGYLASASSAERGNHSPGLQTGVHITSSAQAKFRFRHLQLKLKQQLLMSKDKNGNCSCQDSDVESPVSSESTSRNYFSQLLFNLDTLEM